MNEENPPDVTDENLSRLLRVSGEEPDLEFQRRLIESTLREVHRERARLKTGKRRNRRWRWVLAASGTAAIVLLFVWGVFRRGPQTAGLVKNLYGIVSIENGSEPKTVTQSADIRAGQWIETSSGSEAEVMLEDNSRLLARPRTRLQIKESNGAKTVRLEDGFLRVEAAKQNPGHPLTFETPGARIEVVGTEFDVHVVEKTDGRKQTRVSVTAGEVELESGGKQIALPPNTEGNAEEGRPPVRRSLTPEVNEMIRLIELNQSLADESNLAAGVPAIIEFQADGTATVWTVVTLERSDSGWSRLHLEGFENGLRAFSLEGVGLATRRKDDTLEMELPKSSAPNVRTVRVILSLTGVPDVFRPAAEGEVRFDRPSAVSPVLNLYQFRLPRNAQIEEISPKPVEIREAFSRKLVTIAANCAAFPVPGLATTQRRGGN